MSKDMTGPEAIQIIKDAGISQAEAARLLRISSTAVQKWVKEGGPSGPASVILDIVNQRPDFIETLRQVQE